jgi:putative protein-disulfide isomerase
MPEPMAERANGAHLLYVADPMCSWCYGFSPVITAVADHFGQRGVPVKVLMGGLRLGNTKPMRADYRDYIRSAWTRVAAATGQPFDHAFFERESFTYDTEPACRAVVAMRALAPDQTLAYLSAVSRAFYAANRDTTALAVLAAIAAEHGQDRDQFEGALATDDVKHATLGDFVTASEAGIRGFPTLLVSRGTGPYALVTNGYAPLDGMVGAIDGWLASEGV